MSNGFLSAELAATCNAIGYYDGHKYHLEPHSKETIKDVIRYLRRDDDSHEIRRFVGNAKLLQTDLLPILNCHSKDKELLDVVLRLIVNLTTPAIIVYNEVVPTDKLELNNYLQIITHLQQYKEAFSDHKPWNVLSEYLSILLNKEVEEREEDDQRSVERILILVRNVLHVPANIDSDWRPDNDASVHDQVVWALHQSGMLDLLLYIASSMQESHFYMHILEIICLLVREQPPSLLAQTAAQRSNEEKSRDDQELLKLRQKELELRQNKTRKYLGARHSNFGGTFVVKNMKSISDKELIYHKPLHSSNTISLDFEKRKVKIPKNRQSLKCENVERRSALSVRLILKQFCVEILNAAYNPLMRYIKDYLVRGKTQDNDESYYFNAMKFFMEFNRKYNFQVKFVSETVSVETFHFVQKYLETWHEMMITDKKKIPLWSTRMHIALKAYKELLLNIIAMDVSPDSSVRESSKVIKSNVFYVIEYREMLLILVNTFKKNKYSHQYLIDLIETIHIFLKLLGQFCQNKKIVVQKQNRKGTKKPRKKKDSKKVVSLAAEELWPQFRSEVEKAITSETNKEVIPFDATSEKSIDKQKVDAIKKIQILLKSGDFEEAVALLRASREVWPENDSFGASHLTTEEELNCMKEVFVADLDLTDLTIREDAEKDNAPEEEPEDEEEDEETYRPLSEQTFDVHDLIKRFTSPKVVSVCITLLTTFDKNTAFTNHCIVKMLHRIAWECKLPSMLFQSSLFRIFQQILASEDPKHKELAKMAIYIIRKFTEVAATNKKVFMELLFLKTAKEAYEIECGYGSFQEKSKEGKVAWEEHEEDELRRLHEEYLRTKPSQDVLDWIMDNIIKKERSKRSVKKKMKELGLDFFESKKLTTWSEEQEQELIRLFTQYRENEDPLIEIMMRLSVERSSRNIGATLKRLGLIQDTKELRKKRGKKSGGRGRREESSESESSSAEDETETPEQARAKEPLPDLTAALGSLFEAIKEKAYLLDGVRWLGGCIADCLEDLEDDDSSEVPLVPLTEAARLSIEDPTFHLYLASLGIYRPLQQELYWRFPMDWKQREFLCRCDLNQYVVDNHTKNIEDCTEELREWIMTITGKPIKAGRDLDGDSGSGRDTETAEVSDSKKISKKSKTVDKKNKIKKKRSKKEDVRQKFQNLENSTSDSETEDDSDRPSGSSRVRRRPNIDSDDEDITSRDDFQKIIDQERREVLERGAKNVPSDAEKSIGGSARENSNREDISNTNEARKHFRMSTDEEADDFPKNKSSDGEKTLDPFERDNSNIERKSRKEAKKFSRIMSSDEEVEDFLSTEDFNNIINDQCKEILGGNALSGGEKSLRTFEREDSQVDHKISKTEAKKRSRVVSSDDEEDLPSTEDFNKIIDQQCRELLAQEDTNDRPKTPKSSNLSIIDSASKKQVKQRKRTLVMSSDSEDESSELPPTSAPLDNAEESSRSSATSKRHRLSDSDSDKESVTVSGNKKRHVIESDDEE